MNNDSEKQNRWKRFRRLKVPKGTIKRRARKIETASLKHAHRFIIRRWTNLREVGRDAIVWLVAVGLLIVLALLQSLWFSRAYTQQAPADGGTYAEGVVSRIETMNPLFATTQAEQSASKLIFSSLLDYDIDDSLRTSVAKSWQVQDGKIYTVQLKDNVFWHDGEKLTADDVLFTVKLMQDPQVKAVMYGNWAGVKAEKTGDYEVRFTLPSVFAPFAHSLTFGILPEHILKNIPAVNLRENDFSRKPVGSGPFVFKKLQVIDVNKNRVVVHMDANTKYYGEPIRLNRFQIYTYEDRQALQKALTTYEVNASLGLGADQLNTLSQRNEFHVSSNVVSNGVYALFNNDNAVLKDSKVRQGLLLGTNRGKLIDAVYGRGVALNGPLPDSFVPGEQATQAAYDPKAAAAKLDEAGWKLEGDVRKKGDQILSLTVIAPDSGDYQLILDELKSQWQSIGVTITTQLVNPSTIGADYLQGRGYDVLVYELSIGGDPDVYAYWHSSQANGKNLNFANYRSTLADDALSSARARLDPALRVAKYKTFYEQWLKDTPAIALYQPYLSYITQHSTTSLDLNRPVVDAMTRYRNVGLWAVSQTTVMTTR